MTYKTTLFIFLLLFQVALHAQKPTPSQSLKDAATEFDKLVKGQLQMDRAVQLFKNCKLNSSSHYFCISILNWKNLYKKHQAKQQAQKPIPIRKYRKYVPKFVEGKVTNWESLRNAPVKGSLKGILKLPRNELNILKKAALGEVRCPNNAAVSIAATLEDYLEERVSQFEIGRLYEKGGVCTRNKRNKEHYLTRAGIFYFKSKNFKNAERILSRTEPTDFFHGRTYYWLYEAQMMLGKTKKAQRTLSRLLKRHPLSYHAAIVSLESGKAVSLRTPDSLDKNGPKSKRYPVLNTIQEHARTLINFSFLDTAHLLVDWVLEDYRRMESLVKLSFLEMGSYHAKALYTPFLFLHSPKLFTTPNLQTAYPKAYFELFKNNLGKLDPYLLLAIAKKESIFDPKAVSHAKARGLMQLLPKTGKQLLTAEQKKKPLDLLDPKTNIDLGSKYFAQLLRSFEGNPVYSIASYNAGRDKVVRWKKRYQTQSCALFIDLIPYRETRDYTGFVLSNYFWYLRLYATNPQQRLENAFACSLTPVFKSRAN